MKKIIKILSRFQIVLLFTVLVNQIAHTQYYELPYVNTQSNLNLFILGIELGDTTKIDFNVCNYTSDKYNYFLNSKGSPNAFYIEDQSTKIKYLYLGESGNSSKSNPKSLSFNKCDTIILYFEKISSSTHSFNLIEGKKDNAWDFKGVDLKKQNHKIVERLNGKTFMFFKNVKHQANWLFAETYKFRYFGTIEDFNDNGQVLIHITNVQLIDPSMASVSYLENRTTYLKKAKTDIGNRIWKNAAAGNIIIW